MNVAVEASTDECRTWTRIEVSPKSWVANELRHRQITTDGFGNWYRRPEVAA